MKKKLFTRVLALFAVVVLMFTAFTAWAQDDKPAHVDSVNSPEVLGSRFAFSGVRTSSQIATTVHCTNPGDTDITVVAALHQWDDNSAWTGQLAIPVGQTRTMSFSTGGTGTLLYSEDSNILTASSIGQGRGTIAVDPIDAPIYCTAQILDATAAIPNFVTDLPLVAVDSEGIPILTFLRNTFLPTVQKN